MTAHLTPGSVVYLRTHALLLDPSSFTPIHAAPPNTPPVEITGQIQEVDGQLLVPVTNPFSSAVSDPVNPYETGGEPTMALVYTSDIRDPSEVVSKFLPYSPALITTGADADSSSAFGLLRQKAAFATDVLGGPKILLALGLTAAVTALLVLRNPKHKIEFLAAGTALGTLALWKGTQS